MKCPDCGDTRTGIENTLPEPGLLLVRRWRRCKGCHGRFPTFELAISRAVAHELRSLTVDRLIWLLARLKIGSIRRVIS